MSETEDGRIPLTILGGYLGAGKSTWLRHQLHAGTFPGAHVLVNEAAEIPVDHLLLAGADGLTVLADGCACCEGAGRFVEAMRTLCDRHVNGIILETSGLSDPARIAELIASDGVLARRVRQAETVVVTDALHAMRQLAEEPLWRKQIEAADRIILTKADVAERSALARLAATMAILNPGAAISGAALGVIWPLPGLTQAEPYTLPASVVADRPIRTLRLDLGPDPRWEAVSAWLSAVLHVHGDDLVRVKGTVRAPVGRLLLQSVRGTVQPPEILPDVMEGSAKNESTLVFIGRGLEDNRIERSFQQLAAP